MPKAFDPQAIEAGWYARWESDGLFVADAKSRKPKYAICLPPPNITGGLHMGHALNHTLMDAMSRRRRMQGYEVLWLPGMDHAGIATQSVVEKQLAVDGKTKEDFGRELFIDKVWDWKRESGGTIGWQMRAIGDGVEAAGRMGSEFHDEIHYDRPARRFYRTSNHAGGLEGGITNGEEIRVRQFTVFDLKIGAQRLPNSAFDPAPYVGANRWQVRILTNRSLYAVMPSGQLDFLESFSDPRGRSSPQPSKAAFALSYGALGLMNLAIFILVVRMKGNKQSKPKEKQNEKKKSSLRSRVAAVGLLRMLTPLPPPPLPLQLPCVRATVAGLARGESRRRRRAARSVWPA